MAVPDGGKDARPEARVHGIGGVEPPPVDSPGEPVLHDSGHVLDGPLGGMVETNQRGVSLENARGRTAGRAPVDVEQIGG